MDYEDACDTEVSALEAQREVERHHLRWSDFLTDCGTHATYQGQTVLDWLGY